MNKAELIDAIAGKVDGVSKKAIGEITFATAVDELPVERKKRLIPKASASLDASSTL